MLKYPKSSNVISYTLSKKLIKANNMYDIQSNRITSYQNLSNRHLFQRYPNFYKVYMYPSYTNRTEVNVKLSKLIHLYPNLKQTYMMPYLQGYPNVYNCYSKSSYYYIGSEEVNVYPNRRDSLYLLPNFLTVSYLQQYNQFSNQQTAYEYICSKQLSQFVK